MARKGRDIKVSHHCLRHTTSVEICSAQNPITTNTDDLLIVSADCADDLFDMTNNNSDEMIGDKLNNMYRKEAGYDTPMKKKQLFEYETLPKPCNELLRFKNTQTFLSPTTK